MLQGITPATRPPGFSPSAARKGSLAAALVLRRLAEQFYAPVLPVVVELRQQGLSLRAIAKELDRRGIKTRYGTRTGWLPVRVGTAWKYTITFKLVSESYSRWTAEQVRRVLKRALRPDPADGR
jgi:hypothetical protein